MAADKVPVVNVGADDDEEQRGRDGVASMDAEGAAVAAAAQQQQQGKKKKKAVKVRVGKNGKKVAGFNKLHKIKKKARKRKHN
jgi:hypothetical protein